MSEDPKKKKLVFKKKGPPTVSLKKPVFKLNKRPDEDEEEKEEIPATEVISKSEDKTAQAEAKAVKAEEIPAPVPKAPPVPEEPAQKSESTPFKFYCVYCGQKLSASTAMTGRKISCPSCGHKIEVPVSP